MIPPGILNDYSSHDQLYNLSHGLHPNGQPIINVVTGTPTKFMYDGDPFTKYRMDPIKRSFPRGTEKRKMILMVVFNIILVLLEFILMMTVEVVMAIIAATGNTNLDATCRTLQKS